jgi:hypothetical protein
MVIEPVTKHGVFTQVSHRTGSHSDTPMVNLGGRVSLESFAAQRSCSYVLSVPVDDLVASDCEILEVGGSLGFFSLLLALVVVGGS